MKCVNCNTDNNLKQRQAFGRCKSCGHIFVFEPTKNKINSVKITDVFFNNAIAKVSANQTLFFTKKQLQYSLDRRFRNSALEDMSWWFWLVYIIININVMTNTGTFIFVNTIIIIYLFIKSKSSKKSDRVRQKFAWRLIIVGGFVALISMFANQWFGFTLGVIAIISGKIQLGNKKQIPQTFLISQTEVNNWLNSWQKINGSIEQLLPPPRQTSLPISINNDITKYSFDRAIICDTAAIANFLITNNFHFENNCAILSITGYPENIFNTVREMLQNNPNLKVYALHNASPRGVELADNLRSSEKWFANTSANIYDLGILPKQILKRPAIFVNNSRESARLAKQIPSQVRQKLTPEAIKWLESGNFIELESYSPQRLLQIVIRGIASSDRDTSDDSITWEETTQTDNYLIYSIDTFG